MRILRAARRRIRKAVTFSRIGSYRRALEVPLPTHIQVEPTTRCNATCGTCSRGSLPKSELRNDLSLDSLERILKVFPDLKSIRLLGLGEPFLTPDFESILRTLKDRGIRTWLISNGSFLRDQKVRDLVHDYVSDLGVSIDSADPDEFRRLRPMGRTGLPEVLAGVRKLIQERDAGRSDVIVGFNSAISHVNYPGLEAIGSLCLDLRVDYLAVVAVENWLIEGDAGYEESAMFATESAKQGAVIDRHVSSLRWRLLRRGVLLGYKTSERRLGRCHWPFNSLHVATDGAVTPCCIRTQAATHGIFNLFSGESFEEFWNGRVYRDLRQAHLSRDVSNKMCGRCPG